MELKKDQESFVMVLRRQNVEAFERFPESFTDYQVLQNLRDRNYFQHDHGEWKIFLKEDSRVFEDAKFAHAIGRALSYIEERDAPSYEYIF